MMKSRATEGTQLLRRIRRIEETSINPKSGLDPFSDLSGEEINYPVIRANPYLNAQAIGLTKNGYPATSGVVSHCYWSNIGDVMESPEMALAKEFFSMGNIITGFYVAQTLLFLNSITKDAVLQKIFSSNHAVGPKFTWVIASIYIGAVIGCVIAEWKPRRSAKESSTVISIAIGAGVGRLCIISAVAGVCEYILANVKLG